LPTSDLDYTADGATDLLLVPLGDGGEYKLLRPLSLRGLVTDGDV